MDKKGWKQIERIQHADAGRYVPTHSDPGEFALNWRKLFDGYCDVPCGPPVLCGTPWQLEELNAAIDEICAKKAGDEPGWVAELLKHAPDHVLVIMLSLFNEVLFTRKFPAL